MPISAHKTGNNLARSLDGHLTQDYQTPKQTESHETPLLCRTRAFEHITTPQLTSLEEPKETAPFLSRPLPWTSELNELANLSKDHSPCKSLYNTFTLIL
jgi:hypothetical protein